MSIYGKQIQVSSIVTKDVPLNYMILKVDTMQRNKKFILNLLNEKIFTEVLIQKCNVLVNEMCKPNFEEIISRYEDLFREEIERENFCNLAKHNIKVVEGTMPIVGRNLQVLKHLKAEIDQEVAKLLEIGIITNSESEWAAGIVPVRKKDTGKVRMCVDYRSLNNCTIKDNYLLPRIDGLLDELSDAKWFITLDATNGYYQLEMAEEDRPKTALW